MHWVFCPSHGTDGAGSHDRARRRQNSCPLQKRPSSQSASVAQALTIQVPVCWKHTWPLGHSSSMLLHAAASHSSVVHPSPSSQSASTVHSTSWQRRRIPSQIWSSLQGSVPGPQVSAATSQVSAPLQKTPSSQCELTEHSPTSQPPVAGTQTFPCGHTTFVKRQTQGRRTHQPCRPMYPHNLRLFRRELEDFVRN